MCKIVGIDVIGVANSDHIWTLTNLDGQLLYIDSTWADPVPDEKNYCDMKFTLTHTLLFDCKFTVNNRSNFLL